MSVYSSQIFQLHNHFEKCFDPNLKKEQSFKFSLTDKYFGIWKVVTINRGLNIDIIPDNLRVTENGVFEPFPNSMKIQTGQYFRRISEL